MLLTIDAQMYNAENVVLSYLERVEVECGQCM